MNDLLDLGPTAKQGQDQGERTIETPQRAAGNNALIVLDDAALDVASSAGAWEAFLHQGQVCMTAGRHIVHENVADEYLERLAKRASALPVGDPNTQPVGLGPLINEGQLRRVDRIVTETVDPGAELRAGGAYDGLFYQPTVLAGVTTEMPAFREEIFGPVVVVRDADEAVAVANATEYGLVAAVRTGSPDRGRELAQRLQTGIVHVNDQTLNNDSYAPFGGTGASGNGARFGSQSSCVVSTDPIPQRREAHADEQEASMASHPAEDATPAKDRADAETPIFDQVVAAQQNTSPTEPKPAELAPDGRRTGDGTSTS